MEKTHSPLRLTRMQRLFMGAYNGAWLPALPFLAMSSRIRQGFGKRMAPDDWVGDDGWQDVWMQSASAGEAFLSWEIARRLRPEKALSLLCTTNTAQGMSILDRCGDWCREHNPRVNTSSAWFPFDSPSVMHKALNLVLPKVVVLLETELWPGLLLACAREEVPVVVVNGRMRPKSLAGYLCLSGLFRAIGPSRILAVSDSDAARFGALFGQNRVEVMPNIKFDRFASQLESREDGPEHAKDASISSVLPRKGPFVVLGSVRKEEEHQVLSLIAALLGQRPDVCIGLFPRHMHRVLSWEKTLHRAGIPWAPRSRLSSPTKAGSVILWDRFGELDQAYRSADAVFVGGGLAPKGGQNFLEPLAHGRIPVIGPDWSNFAWVGRDILDTGLVRVGEHVGDVARELSALLDSHPGHEEVRARTMEYVAPRRGGAAMAADDILNHVSRTLSSHD